MTAPDTPLAITTTVTGFAVVGEIDAHTAPEISQAVARSVLDSLEIVEITRPVLSRAAQPLPTRLGTPDAIHLATAILWQERSGEPLTLATHDSALGLAATASGLRVVGC